MVTIDTIVTNQIEVRAPYSCAHVVAIQSLPRGEKLEMDIIGTIDSEDDIDIQDVSDSEGEFKMDIDSSNEGIYTSCRLTASHGRIIYIIIDVGVAVVESSEDESDIEEEDVVKVSFYDMF